MKLQGRRAIITGAARGIGAGCALELAREGADLLINDCQASSDTEAVLREVRTLGRRAELVVADAFTRPGCQQIIDAAVSCFGGVDILISNPARNLRRPFLEYPPEAFEEILRAVVAGGFHMSQLAARQMVEQGGGGKIVFISSIHARVPYAHSVAYNAGKMGLLNLCYTIAGELLPHRINVNAIEPGWIDTPGERHTFGDAAIAAAGPQQPWGRLGIPRDIARAAVFLASADADYITGTSLLVDGGLWLRAARE